MSVMEYYVSQSFDHSKLNNPSLTDLIDVFEDSWQGYVFEPAKTLLRHSGGEVAAMTLVVSYFEAIWIYMSGEDSKGKSKEFFVNGFRCCFCADMPGIDIAAMEIYKHIRCGLAHTGMLKRKVNFSCKGKHAFYLTYPKCLDGALNMNKPVASIVVNPSRMFEGVLEHFEGYVKKLRSGAREDLVVPFEKAVNIMWGLGEEDNIIGMTENEFMGIT